MSGALSAKFDVVQKSGVLDSILNWAKFKADLQAKKTDGSKRSRSVNFLSSYWS